MAWILRRNKQLRPSLRLKSACLCALVLTLGCGTRPEGNGALADGGDCTGVSVPEEGALHVGIGTPIIYRHNPPASGPHWPCWARWGVASQVIAREQWVHNLEHGGVALLYRCADATSCRDEHDFLARIFDRAPAAPTGGRRVLVTADPNLPSGFAAVSWNYVLSADSQDEAGFLCFIRKHEGNGLEDIPDNPPSGCP